MDIKEILNAQRKFFNSGATRSLDFRLEQLKKLQQIIEKHEAEITEALHQDLNRTPTEAYIGDLFSIYSEFKTTIPSLKKWAQPKKVRTPFPFLWPARSEIHYEPYGIALIIGPWNYPFSLVLIPVISAIAAGNCVIVKPSEVSKATEQVILKLINNHFPPEFLYAVAGGPEEMKEILEQKFDYIFFTGATKIGKIVMSAAAKHLTPVTLELGGKCPCIVDETADLDYAASRIVFGKFFNAGQTCVAPDYLYVHKDRKDALLKKIQKKLKKYFGEDPAKNNQFAKIINKNHFDRVSKLLKGGNIVLGGQSDPAKDYIAPTVIDQVSWQDPIMQEEIFGPVLPVLTFDNLEEVIKTVNSHDKPLAVNYFTKDKERADRVINEVPFGNGAINDCSMMYLNPHLPFGGVGASGMGNYRGEFGFRTFSHAKGVYKKRLLFYPRFAYPPFSEKSLKMFKKLFKMTF